MKFIISCVFLFAFHISYSQHSVGQFAHSMDIGKPKNMGAGLYDSISETYTIKGSGYNIWFNRDEFRYQYNKMAGDFVLTANFQFIGEGGDAHRKFGWMIRESEDDAAASMNAVVHGDGLVVMQWRPLRGAYMRDPEDEIFFPKKSVYQIVQLERKGRMMTMRVANPGEPLQEVGTHKMNMGDSVLAGIYISSHNENVVEQARVWNVRIDIPNEEIFQPNPVLERRKKRSLPTIGSILETVDIATGARNMMYHTQTSIDSSAWSTDDNLVLLESGSLRSIAINKQAKTGKKRGNSAAPGYIYFNEKANGTMQLWRKKADGSEKEQLTFDENHNWNPHVSTDGKWLAFISFPPDVNPDSAPTYKRAMIRIMPLSKPGSARVVAHIYGGKNSLKGNPWSPDNKRLVFVSYSK